MTRAVGLLDFQLYNELCLLAVLVSEPPRAARSAIPTVGKLCRNGICTVFQKGGYVIGLILHSFTVIGMPGSKNEIPNALTVEAELIYTASARINACLFDVTCIKFFFEAIHRITLARIYCIVSRNPFCLPIRFVEQSHFKNRICWFSAVAVLIPQRYTPINSLPRTKGFGIYCAHGIALHLTAIPNNGSVRLGNNPISRLLGATLAIPGQERLLKICAYGTF